MVNFFTKNKIKFYKDAKIKSFTLVETLVAVTIIIMAILGPLTVAVYAYSYATDTRDGITSTYLAGEGIELLKYKRDSIYIKNYAVDKSISWSEFKNTFGLSSLDKCFSVSGCALDINNIDSVSPVVPGCSNLYRNETTPPDASNTFLYSCDSTSGNVKTTYIRKIYLTDVIASVNPIPEEDDIKVVSEVSYRKSNGTERVVSVTDFIHQRP